MQTYALTFTPEQMQVLNDALVNLPYFKAAPLIAAINAQVQAQVEARKAETDASA